MSDPQTLLNDCGVFLRDYIPGRYYTTCPRCSAERKKHHQKLKCLGVTIGSDKAFGGCNHCGWTFPEPGAGTANGRSRQSWPHYEYGPDLRKVRRPAGGFFWQYRNGKDWENGTNSADTHDLLYRIDEVKQAIALGEPVLVVEGEKDANTCWRLGFAATCNAHGASEPGKAAKWTAAHSEQLLGADLVVLWDNDDAGRSHADAVCVTSLAAAKSVRTIDLSEEWPDIPKGGDVSDWVAKGGGNAEQLQALIGEARHWPGTSKRPEPEPAPSKRLAIDNISWDETPVPERKWTVHERIPERQVCILSGHGATGKSYLGLHLASAHAAPSRNEWLRAMVKPGPSLFLDAEEDLDEIHIRLNAITEHYECSYQDLIDGGLAIKTLTEDAIMAAPSANGVIQPTALYHQVLEYAGDVKTVQVIIANSANVFAGNESDRAQVQQFAALLRRIALASGGSVTLISHPSLTGLSTATGLSGSTQWHNAVRARMWLKGVTTDDKGEGPEREEIRDLRVLEFLKNQYGRPQDTITLRFRDGMFLPEGGPSTLDKLAREMRCEEVFATILSRFRNTGRNHVSESKSSTYAPKVFLTEPEAMAIHATTRELAGAMVRLLAAGKIKPAKHGYGAAARTHLEPCD